MTTLPIAQLHPNPLNPRGQIDPASVAELADSIRAQGILQPLLVTPDGSVVAGHRRLLAAQLVGLEEVPVMLQNLSQAEQLECMVAENIQREDLSPLQEARAYKELIDRGLTQSDVARQVGVQHNRVQNRLAILKLCSEVQSLYDRRELPTTLVGALAKLTDTRQQQRFANMAARRQLAAPKIEQLIKRSIGESESRTERTVPVDEVPAGPTGLSPTRSELLEQLKAEPDTTISFEDLAKAVEQTCCWCGMDSLAEVCANCPMPQLVARIVRAA